MYTYEKWLFYFTHYLRVSARFDLKRIPLARLRLSESFGFKIEEKGLLKVCFYSGFSVFRLIARRCVEPFSIHSSRRIAILIKRAIDHC